MAKAKKPGKGLTTFNAADIDRLIQQGAVAGSVKALATAEPVFKNVTILRLKGGDFYIGDVKQKKPFPLAILATAHVQMFYENGYDPDNKEPPVCFALAYEQKDLVPSDVSPKKQHDGLCATCRHNQPGSAGDGSWRRACQGRRRIAFLMTDDTSDNPIIGSTEVSPAGLKEFGAHMQGILNIMKVPPSFVETKLDTKLSRGGDGSPYIVASVGPSMTQLRPDWFKGDGSAELPNSDMSEEERQQTFQAYLETTLLGKKIKEVQDTKLLLSPPSLTVPTDGGGSKKPVTGAKRVSVKDAKAARKAKKKS
jgi:hypothetical protein